MVWPAKFPKAILIFKDGSRGLLFSESKWLILVCVHLFFRLIIFYIQELIKCNGVSLGVNFKFSPILLFWYLIIQRWAMRSDVFALLRADFLFDCAQRFPLSIVEYIEVDGHATRLRFRKHFVFVLLWLLDCYIVLRHTKQHVCAFTYVHKLIAYAD